MHRNTWSQEERASTCVADEKCLLVESLLHCQLPHLKILEHWQIRIPSSCFLVLTYFWCSINLCTVLDTISHRILPEQRLAEDVFGRRGSIWRPKLTQFAKRSDVNCDQILAGQWFIDSINVSVRFRQLLVTVKLQTWKGKNKNRKFTKRLKLTLLFTLLTQK